MIFLHVSNFCEFCLFSRIKPFQMKSTLKGKNLLLKGIMACTRKGKNSPLTLLHSERPKLYTISAFLSAIRLRE